MRGDTARVERLLKAYRMLDDGERYVSDVRKKALRQRISAVLPQLSSAETTAYYEGIQRIREMTVKDREIGG